MGYTVGSLIWIINFSFKRKRGPKEILKFFYGVFFCMIFSDLPSTLYDPIRYTFYYLVLQLLMSIKLVNSVDKKKSKKILILISGFFFFLLLFSEESFRKIVASPFVEFSIFLEETLNDEFFKKFLGGGK